MNWLLNRLKEKSTWIAIFTLAGLVGMKIEPELREAIINAILAVAAVAAFVFRENVKERESDERDQSDKNDQLPPIELVGRSERNPPPRDAHAAINPLAPHSRFSLYRDPDDDRVRNELPTKPDSETPAGWNG